MPIGIIVNVLAVIFGGLIGTVAGHKLSLDFKEKLNLIFGACSMAMGINGIVLMKNMPVVVLSIVIGTSVGMIVHLGDKIALAGQKMQQVIGIFMKTKESNISDEEFQDSLLTIIVLFCASGTGIYGSIVAGMSGDHSILLAKSILDIFTAVIFACLLGPVVSFIAVPQFFIFITLFLCGRLIFPYTTPDMINDFKATGGIVLLATGFRMIKVKMFPVADMIPAMLLAMPVSWLWENCINVFL